MVKKKLFAALAVGTFAVAAIAGVTLSSRNTGFLQAGGTEYSVTLNSETGLTATSTGGATFDFAAEGLTEAEGKFGTLTAGGYVTLAEGYSLNNLQSFAVVCDNHEAITLSYGFEEGTWVREGLESWVPSTAGEVSLLNEHPNYIRLGAKDDVTIESITFTYAPSVDGYCNEQVATPDRYLGTDWQVVGGFQGWDTANGTKFTLNSKYTASMDVVEYQATVELLCGQEFKIIKGADWDSFKDVEVVGAALESQITVPEKGDARGGSNIVVNKAAKFTFYVQIGETTQIVIPEGQAIENPVDLDDPELIKTVYFKAPANWGTSVKAHYYDDYGNTTEWPGVAMTNINANLYSIDYNTTYYNHIIFTEGDNQTDKFVSPTDENVCYVYGKGWYPANTEVEPDAPAVDKLFLKPNSNWVQGNAWFAAYIWDPSGATWIKMTDSDSDGVYEMDKPDATKYTKVIFCRMNPDKTALDWSSKWDQTVDLTIPTDGKNLFTVNSGQWNNATGTWSTK